MSLILLSWSSDDLRSVECVEELLVLRPVIPWVRIIRLVCAEFCADAMGGHVIKTTLVLFCVNLRCFQSRNLLSLKLTHEIIKTEKYSWKQIRFFHNDEKSSDYKYSARINLSSVWIVIEVCTQKNISPRSRVNLHVRVNSSGSFSTRLCLRS